MKHKHCFIATSCRFWKDIRLASAQSTITSSKFSQKMQLLFSLKPLKSLPLGSSFGLVLILFLFDFIESLVIFNLNPAVAKVVLSSPCTSLTMNWMSFLESYFQSQPFLIGCTAMLLKFLLVMTTSPLYFFILWLLYIIYLKILIYLFLFILLRYPWDGPEIYYLCVPRISLEVLK